ncbi:MAG: LacI family DNA-binding transcriptional regulator [Opitutaceae bacterium]|jgi:LacI family transcriptional regulator|nr:LacI family DNA-binding transcriptional regulator [Opitutaceae bacterium]
MANTSLKDVARETGLAVSTVSYALRGAPNIPAETCARVREAAERLGYRRNARVAELMAGIRRGRGAESGDRLALVWAGGARDVLGREVAAGAKARAAALGYGMQEFSLAEAGKRPGRLADILGSRGIAGVVFGPVFDRERVEVDWPWERFAMAVVGTAEWRAPLSRAAHHHYEAMRLALAALASRGARRPALWVDAVTNERAHRGWQAAWLAYGPRGSAGRIELTRGDDAERTAAWLRRVRPDAIVAVNAGGVARLREAGWQGTAANTLLLDRQGSTAFAGVDQRYDIIAGHAVDLVVAQLQRNERGLPDPPRALWFPGRWAEAG